jgi:hypothetical protein
MANKTTSFIGEKHNLLRGKINFLQRQPNQFLRGQTKQLPSCANTTTSLIDKQINFFRVNQDTPLQGKQNAFLLNTFFQGLAKTSSFRAIRTAFVMASGNITFFHGNQTYGPLKTCFSCLVLSYVLYRLGITE